MENPTSKIAPAVQPTTQVDYTRTFLVPMTGGSAVVAVRLENEEGTACALSAADLRRALSGLLAGVCCEPDPCGVPVQKGAA